MTRLKERGQPAVSGFIRRRRTVNETVLVEVLGDVVRSALAMGSTYPEQTRDVIKQDYIGQGATEAEVETWLDEAVKFAAIRLSNNLDVDPPWRRFASIVATRDGETRVFLWNPPIAHSAAVESEEFRQWVDQLESIGAQALAWGVRNSHAARSLFGPDHRVASPLQDDVGTVMFDMHVAVAEELLQRHFGSALD